MKRLNWPTNKDESDYMRMRKLQNLKRSLVNACENWMYEKLLDTPYKWSRSAMWGYILNLDTDELEVWKGFQEKPDPGNRYGQASDRGYYPCKMIAGFPLDEVTPEMVKALEGQGEE